MELREAALGTLLGESRNILVQSEDEVDQAALCNRLLEESDPAQAVVVSYAHTVEDWLADTQRSALDSVAFVSVGETVRSTSATAPSAEPMSPPGTGARAHFAGVGDPTDLSALGRTINTHLTATHEAGDGDVRVCFDSVSDLVEAVSLRQAFRFLHLLTTLITARGATAHYHFDTRLTPYELDVLRPLFDAELAPHESHDSGSWDATAISRPGHGD